MRDDDERDLNKIDYSGWPRKRKTPSHQQFPQRKEPRKAKTHRHRHEFDVRPVQTEQAYGNGKGVKTRIKTIMLRNPGITVDGIREKLGNDERFVSRFAVSEIRREFRDTLKLLKALNLTVADIVI